MTSNYENHDNPGIFVRIFDDRHFEILWMDGHGLIEMANQEEVTSSDSIASYLSEKDIADGYARDIYSPWGEYEGVAVLRRLTLYESVHYLGRQAKVCAFLRPKIQAERFIIGLEKGKDPVGHEAAKAMRQYLHCFDDYPQQKLSQENLHRMMEEQLLNIDGDMTSGIRMQ